jgi:hypothetical protein
VRILDEDQIWTVEQGELLTCSKCGKYKPLDSFYRARREKKGRQSECIDCLRARRGNKRIPKQPHSLSDLYDRSSLSTSGCVEWQGPISGGYGKVRIGGKYYQVHRVSFVLNGGTIPDDKHLHHRCKNKICINPDHLALITPSAHSLLHNLGKDKNTCRNGHTGDWYTVPRTGDRRCMVCVRDRRRRRAAETGRWV